MSESFEKMSVIELRQKAKEMGVKLGAGINKQGIVEKLKEAAAGGAAEAPAEPEAEPQQQEEQEPASRPIRSAAIITDDEEIDDDDDVPVLTANPALRAPARMTARPVPAPGTIPARIRPRPPIISAPRTPIPGRVRRSPRPRISAAMPAPTRGASTGFSSRPM